MIEGAERLRKAAASYGEGVTAAGNLVLEVGDEETATCAHCGEPYRVIHGFIYRGGEPFAVYHAGLYGRHPDDRASIAISLGDWSDSASGADRQRIGIQAWTTPEQIEMHFDERDESPWDDSDVFGTLLDRNEALADPRREEFLAVADFLVREDARLRDHLGA